MQQCIWCKRGLIWISLFVLFFVLGCNDNGSSPLYTGPNYARVEYSFGKVTVVHDMAFSSASYDAVLVGYRDSLGDGQKQPIAMITGEGGEIYHSYFLDHEKFSSLDVVTKHNATFLYYSTGTGPAATAGMYCIKTYINRESVSFIPLSMMGTTVHPTSILKTDAQTAVIAGWIEDGSETKAYILEVDTSGVELWSQYISEPGMDVKAKDLVVVEDQYRLACSYEPSGLGANLTHSKVLTLDAGGNLVNSTEMQIPGFAVTRFDWYTTQYGDSSRPVDSGYIVIGQRYDSPNEQSGIINFIDGIGNVTWEATLTNAKTFAPVAIKSRTYASSFIPYSVHGNTNYHTTTFYIAKFVDRTDFKDVTMARPVPVEFVQYSHNRDYDLESEITNVERNSVGELTSATSVVRFWEQ